MGGVVNFGCYECCKIFSSVVVGWDVAYLGWEEYSTGKVWCHLVR